MLPILLAGLMCLNITSPIIQSPTIQEKIIIAAEEQGIDSVLALAIAEAESDLDPDAKNASSTASGVYQFIDSTFLENCSPDLSKKNDPDIQIECAVNIIADGGLKHWDDSKSEWELALIDGK